LQKSSLNRISKYGIDEGFIRPEQFGFSNREGTDTASLCISWNGAFVLLPAL